MLSCKRCGEKAFVKNGIVAGKQRYQCKKCGHNFRTGDERTDEKITAKKALCILLYAFSKGSFRLLGRLFDTSHTQIFRWIRSFSQALPERSGSGTIIEMEFDEMRQFIEARKSQFEPSKRVIVAYGELWQGCPAIVIVQPSGSR